jgi:triosephosphate isomerase
MRQKFIAGNWKMFMTAASARELAAGVVKGLGKDVGVRVAVCPPFPYLAAVAEVLRGSPILLGAQNLYPEKEGAFTGEVSPTMLLDAGCKYVILGHSERRHVLGESDEFINRKVRAAQQAGLDVIFCVGETLQERQANHTEQVLDRQMSAGLAALTPLAMGHVVVAYEPVWAIGTGQHATPAQAQDAHQFLRGKTASLFGAAVAQHLTIQYGGSVKPENAAVLLGEPDVDGALIGGASLKADRFLAIIAAANAVPSGRTK